MTLMTQQLLHVCIAVPDLNAAVQFYRDLLGFKSVFETENGTADGALLGFDTDVVNIKAQHVMTVGASPRHATAINLVEFVEPKTKSADSAPRAMNDTGLTRLALLVGDLDLAFERIAANRSVEIISTTREIVIHEAESTHTSRWFSFLDPFGVFITVTEAPRNDERKE